MQRRQGLFGIGGLAPVYSMSFYLICANTLITLFGSFVSHMYICQDACFCSNLAKTVKQVSKCIGFYNTVKATLLYNTINYH